MLTVKRAEVYRRLASSVNPLSECHPSRPPTVDDLGRASYFKEKPMPYNKLGDLQTLTLSNDVQCDNPCCILTLDCTVQLMGNMHLNGYEANTAIATLPTSMRPLDEICLPAYLDTAIKQLIITPEGEIRLGEDVVAGLLYTNGVSFNVCDRYYNSDIGNNFPQGTSPLRWDGEDY